MILNLKNLNKQLINFNIIKHLHHYNSISSRTTTAVKPILINSISNNKKNINNYLVVNSTSSSSSSLYQNNIHTRKMSTTPPVKKETTIREGVEMLMKRRFFYIQSYEIYGGVAGLYDYGPAGCAIKANLINFWRQHFALNEDMLEVDCSAVTPEVVLKTSGHVAKFADFMVKDSVTGACYRADHLLEGHVEKLLEGKDVTEQQKAEYKHVLSRAGDAGQKELHEMLTKYGVKSPDTGNAITEPYPFNLMFQTQIGPSGQLLGYLRPETAQGIFVNFKRLLEYNGGRLPFAAAQIGNSFRNEIAPRSGLLRVREFTMAEIEHFVHPNRKSHPKFADVAALKVNLLTAEAQGTTKLVAEMNFGEAVAKRIIDNETLAYFMARTQLFLHAVGIKPERLRFRQHQSNEMAHYATDCWDAEIHSSYGWVECVGHADRSCYDLKVHSDKSKVPLVAYEEFKDGPKIIDTFDVKLNKGILGKTFKATAAEPIGFLESLCENFDQACSFKENIEKEGSVEIAVNDNKYKITKDMVSLTKTQKKISGETYQPHVIEPSFGLGRIIYSLIEHAYWVREGDEQRVVLSLPAIIAPVKASILPLTGNEKLVPFIQRINRLLKETGISCKVDDTGSAIGRRYARTDEIGIPFGITIDFETIENDTITLRERDTTKQVRVPIADLAQTIKQLCENTIVWQDVAAKYPAYESQSE